jgi:hypothetical protein
VTSPPGTWTQWRPTIDDIHHGAAFEGVAESIERVAEVRSEGMSVRHKGHSETSPIAYEAQATGGSEPIDL